MYTGDKIKLTTDRKYAYCGTRTVLYVNCTDSIIDAEAGEEIILNTEIFLEIVAISKWNF